MNESSRRSVVEPWALVVLALALMAIGLVMIASTTASLERSLLGPGMWRTPFGRQVLFVVVGLMLLALLGHIARPFLSSSTARRNVARTLLVLSLALLVAALLPGFSEAHRGSLRWLRFSVGGVEVGYQPSELAKLAIVAWLAWLLADGGVDPKSFRRCFAPASVVIGAFVLLVGKEDFGTSALLGAVGVAMLVVGGCRLRHLLMLSGAGAFGVLGLLVIAPYRLARIVAFLDIMADPLGAGYQPRQSLATIASGGWLGSGLGAGVQKYGYLPECHTDFIFAIICEEMGALGAMMVIALFGVFVWLGIRTMWSAASRFERLLAFGLTATIGLQAAMNIAVVTVLAPTTGISLPLVSAGGSGLLTFCVAIGVLVAIAARGVGAAAPVQVGSVDRVRTSMEPHEAGAW